MALSGFRSSTIGTKPYVINPTTAVSWSDAIGYRDNRGCGGLRSDMSDLERIFSVRPAYDCIGVRPCVHGSERCKPGTGGSHGRHNAEMHLTVRGDDAEVTLVVGTGWDLPTVPAHHRHSGPTGRFVEFHTARPRYEGQDRRDPCPTGTCKHWAACYVDSGYTMSDEPTRLLVAAGSDAVWAWLEQQYAAAQDEMKQLTRKA
jgi:hypothetical protein